MTDYQPEITHLLSRATGGDSAASNELIPLLYEELRALAAKNLKGERPGHTLQATALAHEAYLRLVGEGETTWKNRAHFFGAAAQAIRRILIDHARQRMSAKRGAGQRLADVDQLAIEAPVPDADVLAIDDSLKRLAEIAPQEARIVELRFFGGLSVDQVAEVMDLSPRTVAREWRLARAWLRRELGEDQQSEC